MRGVAETSAALRRIGMGSDAPLVRAAAGASLVAVPVAIGTVVVALTGLSDARVATVFCINLIAVLGIGMFSGNSGVVSFGHVSFMGIAAYATGILSLPVAQKALVLPHLPAPLSSIELSFLPSILVTLVVVAIAAAVVGLPISRLSTSAASIGTLGILVIVNVILVGAVDFTRGSQTFYGVPTDTTFPVALAAAILAVFVARAFREIVPGLQLRASREDELASRSMGVHVANLRLLAWIVSGVVVGLAGALQAHNLGAFSPKEFYFTTTFALLAMLVIGGMTTVSGAVGGAVLITLVTEVTRRLESGVTVGPVATAPVFGLTQVVLGLAILFVMYRRRDGLLGRLEIDELLLRRTAPRPPKEHL